MYGLILEFTIIVTVLHLEWSNADFKVLLYLWVLVCLQR